MKWNESGFRPPLCTYRLNWARRTSWGWWDDWDDTALQTQDSKFEPWRSEAEHATSRSRRLPTILTFTRGWGRNIFVSFKLPRAILRRHTTEKHRAAHNSRRTFGETHRWNSGYVPTMLVYKHRRCLFDVIISPMFWVIHYRCSSIFSTCSAKHRRCYGDASLSVLCCSS